MSEWSLPCKAQERFDEVLSKYSYDNNAKTFFRGGFWKNFLSKYEEANNMHKKMLYVSAKIKKYADSKKPLCDKAVNSLYEGQCNCAYWHGVFGGLYLPHLRNAVYHSLLKAEDIYNKYFLKRPSWTAFDFDCDYGDEWLYESKTQNIYVEPNAGGTIFEFDIFKIKHNLCDSLTRRREAYHKKLEEAGTNVILAGEESGGARTIHDSVVKVKEYGLEKYLAFDSYRRSSLADHFFKPDIRREDFIFSRYEEQGDFIGASYDAKLASGSLVLKRSGKASGENISVVKTITPLNNQGYKVEYSIKNNSNESARLCFSSEQVFAFSSKTGDDDADLKDVTIWKRSDSFLKAEVEVKLSEPCDVFVVSVETVATSEDGYEKTYQATAFLPLVKFNIEPDAIKTFSFETIVHLK